MNKTPLVFEYLGDRDYINGISMIEGLLSVLAGEPGGFPKTPGVIAQFKLLKELRAHGQALVIPTAELTADFAIAKEAVARLDFVQDTGKRTALLFEHKTDDTPGRDPSYDPGKLIESMDNMDDGRSVARLKDLTCFMDIIKAAMEANKRITFAEHGLSKESVTWRWAYMSNVVYTPDGFPAAKAEARFETKGLFPSGPDGTFAVKALTVTGAGPEINAEICFLFRRK